MNPVSPLPQTPIQPGLDLRMMLRNHLARRSLECMKRADGRRDAALARGDFAEYRRSIVEGVGRSHRDLPTGPTASPPVARTVSIVRKDGYRMENILFESFPGWEVNATVYVPEDFQPPFPAIVVPVGHSGKQFVNYQLPCQVFARSGFLAITFDPPGQAGEKQTGNDHFRDGVRAYLVGQSSSRYFVADALRCIDYIYTRVDAETRAGVAMTGVSGGGTTTLLAGLLDERISVIGPSCCLSPLADLAITQCYGGCPEGRMWRRYADGLDYIDTLCAFVPKPALVMAGKGDEVFRLEDTEKLVGTVRRFYGNAGVGERFEFFVDDCGHAYTPVQATRFVRFLDRWLVAEAPERPVVADTVAVNPVEELKCRPRQDVNMRTLTLERAQRLRRERRGDPDTVSESARRLSGLDEFPPEAPGAELGPVFQAWVHQVRQILIRTGSDIEIPATLITAMGRPRTPMLLHFDDAGRDRLFEAGGILGRAVRFLDREGPTYGSLSVDLRGWGDSEPAVLPYEIPSWASRDRFFAYSSCALGDCTMSMRVRDGLAALSFLRSRPEAVPDGIVVSGCGLGALVAAHLGAIDRNLEGVVIWDGLSRFEGLLEAEDAAWSPESFIYGVLEAYDLPDLLRTAGCPVRWINPLDAMKKPVAAGEIEMLRKTIGPQGEVTLGDEEVILSALGELLGRADKTWEG